MILRGFGGERLWDGGLGVGGRFSGWNGGREEYSTWGNRLAWYLRGVQEGEVVIIEKTLK